MRCEQCKFWERGDSPPETEHPDDHVGVCHRHAPRPIMPEVIYEVLQHLTTISWAQKESNPDEFKLWEGASGEPFSWPTTTASSWCGEHQEWREP